MTIGGFDPSGGAGVLADVKTIERLKGYAIAVQTSNTIQTENKFDSVNWVSKSLFDKQLKLMLDSYVFKSVKIGLIPFEWMSSTLDLIRASQPNIFLVWDPILSASAGFNFDQKAEASYLNSVDLITPNWNEIQFFGIGDAKQIARNLTDKCSVLLKGGHSEDKGKDYLYTNKGSYTFNPKNGTYTDKHGTGCILSSAIATFISRDFTLMKSCYKGKRYIESSLASNMSKLAYHS